MFVSPTFWPAVCVLTVWLHPGSVGQFSPGGVAIDCQAYWLGRGGALPHCIGGALVLTAGEESRSRTTTSRRCPPLIRLSADSGSHVGGDGDRAVLCRQSPPAPGSPRAAFVPHSLLRLAGHGSEANLARWELPRCGLTPADQQG